MLNSTILNPAYRLVVMPEAQTPPTPGVLAPKTVGRVCGIAQRSQPLLDALAFTFYATAPALSRTVLDARCKSVGWTPFAGCAFALAASAEIRLPLASMPCPWIVTTVRNDTTWNLK